MSIIRVRFTRFWEGFDPEENFIINLIENLGFAVKVVEGKHEICDIEFVSVYASNKELTFQILPIIKNRLFGTFRDVEEKYKLLNVPKTANALRRIWVTGENVRPPLLMISMGTSLSIKIFSTTTPISRFGILTQDFIRNSLFQE
jgi:hypothetical protein